LTSQREDDLIGGNSERLHKNLRHVHLATFIRYTRHIPGLGLTRRACRSVGLRDAPTPSQSIRAVY